MESLDKRRDKAKENLRVYIKQSARAYEGLVKEINFNEGVLVLKTVEHVGTKVYKKLGRPLHC